MRKEFAVLLCMVGMVSAVQMMATPNATIYLNPTAGATTQYNITIFGNDENKIVNVSIMLDGDAREYATVQETLVMEANPSGKCCGWYPIMLVVSIPENFTDEIDGKLFAVVKQCEGTTGSCADMALMKHLVLRPEEAMKATPEAEIPPENKTISDVKPISSENASVDSFDNRIWVAVLIVLILTVAYSIIKTELGSEVKKDEKR
ncbi:MAG: hypothetical protein Sv326_1352 (plasmid) [Candidatus Fermentimicrarchaeum limneticum]|uniref:Uncharacterized protein n=1 Tax=Fermentimicrarchaeum limneticum TaxID=2795018 RepID=A0A7D5XQG3_FERL1|nr:MAG: hypothetical protein Sv326_1352 [Candidatus Fermentimicrarchaeum limneticum]